MSRKIISLVGMLFVIVVLSGITGYEIGSFKKPVIKTIFKDATQSAVLAASDSSKLSTPEPLTNCSNPDCGSIVIPKSQCSNSAGFVCCFFKDGKKWYSSREACKSDQDLENK